MKNENQSKQVLLSVLAVAILVVAVVGVSFAAFSYTSKTTDSTKQNSVTTGTIAMTYTEDENGIAITDAMPMTDADGKAMTTSGINGGVFNFNIKTDIVGQTTVTYDLSAVKVAVTETAGVLEQLPDNMVKLCLYKKLADETDYSVDMEPANYAATGTASSATDRPATEMQLAQHSYTTTDSSQSLSKTDSFQLKMWVNDNYVIDGVKRQYKVKVNAYARASHPAKDAS